MRLTIASRIFSPETSAASFRLNALASALDAEGHEVSVLTVRPPEHLDDGDHDRSYKVKRARVMRDKSGYVRGYIQYLSFDVPLFFRILFGSKVDAIIVEPPPTTGFAVRLAAALRRIPYVYYAADIWADASAQTGAPKLVVRLVRRVETFVLRGAKLVLSVSRGVSKRLSELGVTDNVVLIGNGIDVEAFGDTESLFRTNTNSKRFLYAGTASEWHGAGVFVEALPQVLNEVPDAELCYIGGGSEKDLLEARALELGVSSSVTFEDIRDPADLGPELSTCCAALASVRPGTGYDFAFPTKLYSAAVCGAPLIYSGVGPAIEFVESVVLGHPIGKAVDSSVGNVAHAMIDAAMTPVDFERRRSVRNWASEQVSIAGVVGRAVTYITQRLSSKD